MVTGFNDPFDALFALQRALDARLGSEWIGRGTAAGGSYPPVNFFQWHLSRLSRSRARACARARAAASTR